MSTNGHKPDSILDLTGLLPTPKTVRVGEKEYYVPADLAPYDAVRVEKWINAYQAAMKEGGERPDEDELFAIVALVLQIDISEASAMGVTAGVNLLAFFLNSYLKKMRAAASSSVRSASRTPTAGRSRSKTSSRRGGS